MSTRYSRITTIEYDDNSLWEGDLLEYLIPSDIYPLGLNGEMPLALGLPVARAAAILIKHGHEAEIMPIDPETGVLTVNSSYIDALYTCISMMDPPGKDEITLEDECDLPRFIAEVKEAIALSQYAIQYHVS